MMGTKIRTFAPLPDLSLEAPVLSPLVDTVCAEAEPSAERFGRIFTAEQPNRRLG